MGSVIILFSLGSFSNSNCCETNLIELYEFGGMVTGEANGEEYWKIFSYTKVFVN